MIALTLIGAMTIGGVLAYGIVYIVKNVIFNKNMKRYVYEQVRDVDGKWYEKVVDTADKDTN